MRSDIKRQPLLWLVLVVMGVFVAACGVTTTAGAANGAAARGTSAAGVTTQTIERLTPSPSSSSVSAPSAQALAGPVTLSLDKTHYNQATPPS